MGVDIRWFNHDKREYLHTGARWGFIGHPSACLLYVLMRDKWNGDHIRAHRDDDEEYQLASEYRNVTAEAEADLAREGCYCIPGKTPDD